MTSRYPNTFLAGAPKSGTTFVAGVLSRHPEIFVPPSKEPGFFSTDAAQGNFYRGWKFYEKNFWSASEEKVLVDASTRYFYEEESAALIANNVRDPRIVIILRKPVDRAYSNYWQYVKSGFSLAPFDVLVEQGDERLRHMVYVSMYGVHLERFVQVFGSEAIKVITYEELRDHPEACFGRLYEFLGVSQCEHEPDVFLNVKNPPGRPRSRMLARILRQRQAIQTLKGLIPASTIKPLRTALCHLRALNTKQKRYNSMSSDTRKLLWERLETVPEDVERAVGVDTTVWKEDRDALRT